VIQREPGLDRCRPNIQISCPPRCRSEEGIQRTGIQETPSRCQPQNLIKRLGLEHSDITAAQQTLYRQFAATGKPLGWTEIGNIERQALVSAGAKRETASSIVDRAIGELQAKGVKPTRIPWAG